MPSVKSQSFSSVLLGVAISDGYESAVYASGRYTEAMSDEFVVK